MSRLGQVVGYLMVIDAACWCLYDSVVICCVASGGGRQEANEQRSSGQERMNERMNEI